jgi:hypothetical protein
LRSRIVVIVEVVDTIDAVPVVEESFGKMKTDEAGGAGDEAL